MKKIFLPLLLAVAFSTASGQGLRLNGYVAYVFDDGFNVYNGASEYYSGKIKGGVQYGAGLEYMANPMYGVELLWLYKKSDVPTTFKLGNLTTERKDTFQVTHNWIMLSGNSHVMKANKKLEGIAGLMLGALMSDVSSPEKSANSTNFAWGFKLGGDIWLSDKIALKLQTQILSASKAVGGTVYYGYWGPVAVPGYVTLWQFGLGGGLVFKFGGK
jgi:hypothetical protein